MIPGAVLTNQSVCHVSSNEVHFMVKVGKYSTGIFVHMNQKGSLSNSTGGVLQPAGKRVTHAKSW